MSDSPLVSIFVPAHNEEGNITPLCEKIARAFDALGVRGEIVLVDDGSTDGTLAEAQRVAARLPFLRVLHHRKRWGKTEAMRTGLPHCRGQIIMLFDADLEADPEEDIPKLFAKINEGYDVVAGWRQGRRDRKIIASKFANFVSRHLFGLRVHDMNWIKAFRREVLQDIPLRSDWHRYILILAAAQGYTIAEVPVNYHPRTIGQSKYGIERLPISFLDVLVVWFLLTFSRRPMLFFGGIGLATVTVSLSTFAILTVMYLINLGQRRPIFEFAGVLLLVGVLFFVVGFLAELIVSQNERLDALAARLRDWERRDESR